MADEYLHDTIEKYLLGQLSPAESARLEADMAVDPSLFEQVEIQRLGLMGMRRLAAADLSEKFARWDEDLDAAPSPPTNRNFWFWTTTALLLLLTTGAFWHFRQIRKEWKMQEQEKRELVRRDSLVAVLQADYQQKIAELAALLEKSGSRKDSLAMLKIEDLEEKIRRKEWALRDPKSRRPAGNPQIAMQLAPPAKEKATRGGGGSGDSTLAAAQKAYDAANYDEAIRLLNLIPLDDPRQTQVTQMLPYALFYDERFEEAIPAFVLMWAEFPAYQEMEAQGYLLLCLVAEGKIVEARRLRRVIMENRDHAHYKMADRLKDVLGVK